MGVRSVLETVFGPLQNKFNPVQRRSQSFSWVRALLHVLLLLVVIGLFVGLLVYGLVRRDVTVKQEKPQKPGFTIDDDGDLTVCDCQVSSYSLMTLIGTLELDQDRLRLGAEVCKASALDCYQEEIECTFNCGLTLAETCNDFGVCDEEQRACMEECSVTQRDCDRETVQGVHDFIAVQGVGSDEDDEFGHDDDDDDDLTDNLPPPTYLGLPQCEVDCFVEQQAAVFYCGLELRDSYFECTNALRRSLNSTNDALFGVFSDLDEEDLIDRYCPYLSSGFPCIEDGLQQYGQCLRNHCEDQSFCNVYERGVIFTELYTKLTTMLGNAIISVPQYYGSEKKTIRAVEDFVEQTIDFWGEFVLKQGTEFVDGATELCVDGEGLCAGYQSTYSPMHAVDQAALTRVIRGEILAHVENNKDELYDRYLDLCGDVTCVVFQEKKWYAVLFAAAGQAGGYMSLLALVFAIIYSPIYKMTSSSGGSASGTTDEFVE